MRHYISIVQSLLKYTRLTAVCTCVRVRGVHADWSNIRDRFPDRSRFPRSSPSSLEVYRKQYGLPCSSHNAPCACVRAVLSKTATRTISRNSRLYHSLSACSAHVSSLEKASTTRTSSSFCTVYIYIYKRERNYLVVETVSRGGDVVLDIEPVKWILEFSLTSGNR